MVRVVGVKGEPIVILGDRHAEITSWDEHQGRLSVAGWTEAEVSVHVQGIPSQASEPVRATITRLWPASKGERIGVWFRR
jgi:hypothetical protein